MKQEDKKEIDKLINEKLNLIERITKLEVIVEKIEKFNEKVTLGIIITILGWIIIQILQKFVIE